MPDHDPEVITAEDDVDDLDEDLEYESDDDDLDDDDLGGDDLGEEIDEDEDALGFGDEDEDEVEDDDEDDDEGGDDEDDEDDEDDDLDDELDELLEEDEEVQPLDTEEGGSKKGKAARRKPELISDDEFTCRSCFLVKKPSQLADREAMLCYDCV